MIRYLHFTADQIKEANRLASEMGVLKNSITSGEGNLAGFIGELSVVAYLGGEVRDTYDYDVLVGDHRTDVKTKRCTSEPSPHYNCSVASYNTQQDCDSYTFVRVRQIGDNWDAWLLGFMEKDDFYRLATFNKQGDYDPSSSPSRPFYFTADCYNVPISQLRDIEELRA